MNQKAEVWKLCFWFLNAFGGSLSWHLMLILCILLSFSSEIKGFSMSWKLSFSISRRMSSLLFFSSSVRPIFGGYIDDCCCFFKAWALSFSQLVCASLPSPTLLLNLHLFMAMLKKSYFCVLKHDSYVILIMCFAFSEFAAIPLYSLLRTKNAVSLLDKFILLLTYSELVCFILDGDSDSAVTL